MNAEGQDGRKILKDAIRDGDLTGLSQYLEVLLPSLPREDQIQICIHGTKENCLNVPCLEKLTWLAQDAVKASQLVVFEYLWDKFLDPNHIPLSWPMLVSAAERGLIDFAESFWARDPDCFKILSPGRWRGPPEGESQITSALQYNQFVYVDYILAHGADINGVSALWNLVRTSILHGGKPRASHHHILLRQRSS